MDVLLIEVVPRAATDFVQELNIIRNGAENLTTVKVLTTHSVVLIKCIKEQFK